MFFNVGFEIRWDNVFVLDAVEQKDSEYNEN